MSELGIRKSPITETIEGNAAAKGKTKVMLCQFHCQTDALLSISFLSKASLRIQQGKLPLVTLAKCSALSKRIASSES